MVKSEGGRVEYAGNIATLVADVGTMIFAMRENIICSLSEEEQADFLKDYEKVIMGILATPAGKGQDGAAEMLKVLYKTMGMNP